MARYIDADKIDYSMASVYQGKDRNGRDVYRRSAIAFESDINEIPTADFEEVRHGEWEQYGLRNPQCSLCHSYHIEKSRYCPNCGAKMNGGKTE